MRSRRTRSCQGRTAGTASRTQPNPVGPRLPYQAQRSLRLSLAAARAAGADERQDASPRVFAFALALLERAIEERVGRTRVGLDVVRDPGIVERRHKCGDVTRGDPRIGAAEQSKDRRSHTFRIFRRYRPRLSFAFAEASVETDDSGESGYLGRGEERNPSPETEAEDERPGRPGLAFDVRACRGDVGEDVLWPDLTDVRRVLEVVGASRRAGRPAKVIEGDRVHAGRGEAVGELLVKRMETAYVGRDHHRHRRLRCAGDIRAELRRVG